MNLPVTQSRVLSILSLSADIFPLNPNDAGHKASLYTPSPHIACRWSLVHTRLSPAGSVTRSGFLQMTAKETEGTE